MVPSLPAGSVLPPGATALRLRRLARRGADVDALRALYRPLARVDLVQDGAFAAVSEISVAVLTPPTGSWACLSLAPENRAALALSVLLPPALVVALGIDWDTPSAVLSLEIALEDVMDAVDAAFGTRIELLSSEADQARQHWRPFQATMANGDDHTFWIGADQPALRHLSAVMTAWPAAIRPCPIQLPAAVRIGSITQLRPVLRGLTPGDTILPGPEGIRLDHGHLVLNGHVSAPVDLTRESATLTKEPDMTPDDTITSDDRLEEIDANPLDYLPVTLDFRLPATDLTLDEVRDLTTGSVISLNMDADRPVVDLCVGNRTIGRGELVEIAGRLAVHVLRVGA